MAVEELYESGSGISIGEPERFFDLVEENMDTMPVSCLDIDTVHYNNFMCTATTV